MGGGLDAVHFGIRLTGHQFDACKFYADHSQYILDSICSCLHFRYNYADKSIQHFVVYSFLHFSYCWIFSIFHIVGVFFPLFILWDFVHLSYCGILPTFHIEGFCGDAFFPVFRQTYIADIAESHGGHPHRAVIAGVTRHCHIKNS